MDSSSLQLHHQEIMASESLDSMLATTKPESQGQQQQQQQEKKPRPPADQALNCPRCDSTNTKFCYYNNYSLSQPRYFCKSCRRYWTKGGTLRNVPVGGGCRKNRRSSSSSSSRSRTTLDYHHPNSSSSSPPPNSLLLPPFDLHHHHDLTLALASLQKQVIGGSMGFDDHHNDTHENISLLGNPIGNAHYNLLGNSLLDTQSINNGLQHLYYGLGGSGSLGDVDNGGGNTVNVSSNHEDHHRHPHDHQMGLQFDQHNNQEILSNTSSGSSTPTTMKPDQMGEFRSVFSGFPWQFINKGEGNYMMNIGVSNDHELDSLKDQSCWNSTGVIAPSNWHSLLNSPLM